MFFGSISGLDAEDERLVWSKLMRMSPCQRGQYFYLSPKLPPLDYNGGLDVNIVIVNNGAVDRKLREGQRQGEFIEFGVYVVAS